MGPQPMPQYGYGPDVGENFVKIVLENDENFVNFVYSASKS